MTAQPDLFGPTPARTKAKSAPLARPLQPALVLDAVRECYEFLQFCRDLSRQPGFLVLPRDVLIQVATDRSPEHGAAMAAIIDLNITINDAGNVVFPRIETRYARPGDAIADWARRHEDTQ